MASCEANPLPLPSVLGLRCNVTSQPLAPSTMPSSLLPCLSYYDGQPFPPKLLLSGYFITAIKKEKEIKERERKGKGEGRRNEVCVRSLAIPP